MNFIYMNTQVYFQLNVVNFQGLTYGFLTTNSWNRLTKYLFVTQTVRLDDHTIERMIMFVGGYGTLEELLEVIAWSQLGIHDKPVGLLNVDGYYNSLLAFIDKAVEEGFICPNARQIFVSAPTANELMNKLEVN